MEGPLWIEVSALLWRWRGASGAGSWHFLTIEGDAADAVRLAAVSGQWLDRPRGFGSAKVTARIGSTLWSTSVFPHKESGGWLLPVKASVRKAEDLHEGDMVDICLSL